MGLSNVTKEELIEEICNDTRLSKRQVREVIDALFTNIIFYMSHGRRVMIHGFGVFEIQHRNPRLGRNPHTGEAVPIPERTIPKFIPGEVLKRAAYRPVKGGKTYEADKL